MLKKPQNVHPTGNIYCFSAAANMSRVLLTSTRDARPFAVHPTPHPHHHTPLKGSRMLSHTDQQPVFRGSSEESLNTLQEIINQAHKKKSVYFHLLLKYFEVDSSF